VGNDAAAGSGGANADVRIMRMDPPSGYTCLGHALFGDMAPHLIQINTDVTPCESYAYLQYACRIRYIP